jgi:hypothetical protein
MSGTATRRGFVALGLVFVAAIVMLLLGHEALTGYAEKSRGATAAAPPPPGVSGTVRLADGSPAPSARVVVEWRDSEGRPGETPALPDAEGRFRAKNLPARASVGQVRASMGPLAASGPLSEGGSIDLALPKEFALRGRVRSSSKDAAPAAGAKLSLAGVSATADERGSFRLEGVPAAAAAGSLVLHVEADGFRPLDWPLSKDDPPETYQDLTVRMEPVK